MPAGSPGTAFPYRGYRRGIFHGRNVAPMDRICDLAEKYDALVMVDESHSAGVVGPTGHGVSEQYGTYGRVDIYTGTLGKAFGGALGGFTTGRKEIIDCCANAAVRTSSPTHWLRASSAPARGIQDAQREQCPA